MGLDIYLDWPGAAMRDDYPSLNAEVPSEKYPDHYCKRNYLRSSYNEAGFNNVVGNLTGKDLYTIFEPIGANRDEYNLTPTDEQLLFSRRSAEEALELLRAAPQLSVSFERAQSLRPQDGIITSDEAALAAYLEETNGKEDPFGGGGWSSAKGAFWPKDPLEIFAVMPGKGLLGDIGVYIVFKKDLTWYIEACEIVIEFIDEALSHPGRTMTWSG